MPRLFIGPKEIDFFNDISKETIKDVVGQKIYVYPLSFIKSDVDDVYEEAVEKIFDNPIVIDCMVDWQPPEVKTTKFGQDSILSIKVYVQSRDMIQKQIEIKDGDFFSYGADLFEITTVRTFRNIYGQVEYDDGIEITAKQSRRDNFATKILGPPKDEKLSDSDAIQENFYQQRGFSQNQEGETGDHRDLVDKGRIDSPDIDKPARVGKDDFYGEGDQ